MAQRLENVNIWIKLQCEEKEEECSSTNKNQSKTGRSKNNKWNKNNTKKNNNDNKDLLCEPNLRNKYMKETCRIFYMRLLRMRPACPTNKYPVFKGSYYKQFNYTGEGANAVASLSKAQ